jgi:hypothetical protein
MPQAIIGKAQAMIMIFQADSRKLAVAANMLQAKSSRLQADIIMPQAIVRMLQAETMTW